MIDRNKVIELAKELPSCAAVARTLGISRERVRQICNESGVFNQWKPPEGYIFVAEAATKLGYTKSSIRRLVARGAASCLKHGKYMYVNIQKFSIGNCVCGKPIGKRRRKFCSKECLQLSINQSHTRSNFRGFHKRTGQSISNPYFAPHDHNSRRVYGQKKG